MPAERYIRRSLRPKVARRTSTVSDNAYQMFPNNDPSQIPFPMYVISVAEVMKMESLQNHREMLVAGSLTTWSEEISDKIIFVSHQWCGYDHPDPSNEQLRVLQATLKRLMEGKTSVENNWKQQIIFKKKGVVKKEFWKDKLPDMYIWYDFVSLPQPTGTCMQDLHNMGYGKKDLDNSEEGEEGEEGAATKANIRTDRSTSNAFTASAGTSKTTMRLLKVGVESLHCYISLSW